MSTFINDTRRFWYTRPLVMVLVVTVASCTQPSAEDPVSDQVQEAVIDSVSIPTDLPWSQRMALSVMKRNPSAWMTDFRSGKGPKWNYTHGLICMAIQELGNTTGDSRFNEYVRGYADSLTTEEGEILGGYDLTQFNIDHINPGRIFFDLYEDTGEQRYLEVLQTLYKQLLWQPQTAEGGYWHKLRYPYQVWLDGVYMGEPFYAEYARLYNHPEAYEHIARQFILAESKLRDSETGLLYHGWDASRLQAWADPETGRSSEIWGRALGWYAMALVDVLDNFPDDHPQRPELIAILGRLATAVTAVQDERTGLWLQVMDKPEAEGNYLEATVSSMLSYTLIKAVNKGYIREEYREVARKAYDGIIENLIEVAENGEVHLHKCCSVAGLGGDPYRDGSLEYYMSEPVVSNDTKGTGPFILASIEFEKN